ncbi:MAG: FtsQ-type POTRA domain-containing protein [Candidatus Eremiobacteraeota bacterium]|nr:FtsQ-type POTRA domain-containing protein [Candidatus Eremiobacteraeota bacterium]MBV9408529.1 FtsQ-type POTRA domain-containing protein [Candidatus Eremiobacteraeota bacterium]
MRPFWFVALILAVLAAWGGGWLVRSPWFRVAHVGVEVPLAAPVTRDQVQRTAAIAPGANVWLLDAHAIARRIEAIPYVDRATVARGQFPAPYVDLAVTVRRPSACVRGGGAEVTIDASARVLQTGCATKSAPWIDAGTGRLAAPGATVADPDVAQLLADARTLADASLVVRSLRRDRWGGLEAVDASGVTLRFGEDADLAQKTALVGPVRAGIGTKRPVKAIDLRAPRTPTVEFR